MKHFVLACGVAVIVASHLGAQAPAKRSLRTPWGDPDLQGNYTNLYEDGTPLERPKEFDGRTLDQVRGDEMAKLKAQVQARTINNFDLSRQI